MTEPNAASREARARQAAASVRPNSPWARAVLKGGRDDDDAVLAAMAALALADEAASQPREGARYRHLKRGTVYEMIGTAELQASQPQCDHAELAIYRGADGKLWARNTGEFHDGRFAVHDTAPTDQAQRGEERDVTVRDALSAAYVAGCIDTHENYQPDRAPEFGEAGSDYASSQAPILIETLASLAQSGDPS